MIADIDKDGSGTIDFEDFLAMMTTKMGERDSKEEILKAFRLFDDDETGKISFKNLKRVAKELGESMTDEELQARALLALAAAAAPRVAATAALPRAPGAAAVRGLRGAASALAPPAILLKRHPLLRLGARPGGSVCV